VRWCGDHDGRLAGDEPLAQEGANRLEELRFVAIELHGVVMLVKAVGDPLLVQGAEIAPPSGDLFSAFCD
jgi:hypothetical protein